MATLDRFLDSASNSYNIFKWKCWRLTRLSLWLSWIKKQLNCIEVLWCRVYLASSCRVLKASYFLLIIVLLNCIKNIRQKLQILVEGIVSVWAKWSYVFFKFIARFGWRTLFSYTLSDVWVGSLNLQRSVDFFSQISSFSWYPEHIVSIGKGLICSRLPIFLSE